MQTFFLLCPISIHCTTAHELGLKKRALAEEENVINVEKIFLVGTTKFMCHYKTYNGEF